MRASVFAIHSDGSLNDIINISSFSLLPQHAPVLEDALRGRRKPLTFLCFCRCRRNHKLSRNESKSQTRVNMKFLEKNESFFGKFSALRLMNSSPPYAVRLTKVYRNGKLTQWEAVLGLHVRISGRNPSHMRTFNPLLTTISSGAVEFRKLNQHRQTP